MVVSTGLYLYQYFCETVLSRLEDYNLGNISLPTWELIPRLIVKVGLTRLEDYNLGIISLPTWELIPRLIVKVGLTRLED